MSTRSVLRSFGIISFFTLLSRCLGLIRDIASASLFGTTFVWDAFLISFMIPNLFRGLLGEGALSSSFIPIFADTLKREGRDGAWQLTNRVLTILFLVTAVIVLAAVGVLLLVEDAVGANPKLALTLSLTRLLLPYLILVNLTALAIAASQSLGGFGIPAASPILLNFVWMASLYLICPFMGPGLGDKIYGLAYGLLAAGVAQLAMQCFSLRKKGWRYRPAVDHPGVRKILALMGPAAAGVMLHRLNVTIDLALGYTLGEGAVSSLWYGGRLMQFPLGLFAIAMGTVVLPTFSGQTAAAEMDKLKETLSFSLRTIFIIMIPASVGLIVLAHPIVQLLFERNAFDSVSTARAASTLMFYCLGLVAYSGGKILAPCFYALKDTRTPVRIVIAAVIVNLILNLILMQFLREAGLALATSISGFMEYSLLFLFLRRKIGNLGGRKVLLTAVKALFASSIMGAVALVLHAWVIQTAPLTGLALKAAAVLGPIAAGVLAYVGVCLLLRMSEMEVVLKQTLAKVKGRSRCA
ncbi:MAG: murein biosynthesis integral membrane protein MurJ [Candidatus Omnitrophica bacterium]|nr:murein biosynthesis integral membrane protein MurJ [Candidatus Omnitrophota bacterium]